MIAIEIQFYIYSM